MSAINIIKAYAKKSLTKNQGSGITTLPSQFMAESKAGEIAAILQQAGMPLQQLDNFIRTEADLLKFLNIIEASSKPRVIPGSSAEGKAITEKLFGKKGEVVEFPQKRTFKEEIEAMKKSGDLVDEKDMVISKKITDREMFKNSNLNKEPVSEKFIDYTIQDINKKEPIEGMKIANKIIKREGEFKDLTEAQSQRILKETDDHLTGKDIDYDPEDFYATGGRAGYQTGNQVTPQVDARMNLDYDTLVNQNQAQADTQAQSRNLNTNINAIKAAASVPYNFAKGILGNLNNPQDLTQVSLTQAQKSRLNEIAKSKGTPTGNINYADYGSPTETFSGIFPKTMSPLDASLALTMGGTDFRTNPEGGIEFLGGKYDFNKGSNPVYNFIDRGGIAGAADRSGVYDKVYGLGEKTFDVVQGAKNLFKPTEAAAAITDPVVDQDRISEIVEQQKAAGVPDEGLITNQKPTMADVAGPSEVERFKKAYDETMYGMPSEEVNWYGTGRPNYEKLLAQYKNWSGYYGDGSPYFSDPEQGSKFESLFGKSSGYNLASGGRAGYYTGGMVDVEPNLSDIGHGSDALMARTRLVSPDGQATTSTGLNYLLAEDNDNIRVPFSAGGGGRRAFLKLLATLGGGIAGIKTGILGLGGKETGKQVAKEVVKSAGTSGNPPPYFFKLVDKIRTMGDDTLATKDKAIAKKYKDYTMEEDFAGNIEIIKKGDDVAEDVYMSYKVDEIPVKGKKGSTKVEEYEEYTARPDAEGKMKDVEPGVPDEVVQEGTMFEDNMTEFGKAEGGRIGFSGGGLLNVLSRLGIKGSSRRFLEKAFGKENFENMIKNDPDMHRGLLEVVEMFRNRDKEGLKMYMQKFLPHMDDATVEEFIVGSRPDIEGLTGQLTRLGSGRDYKGKLEMMKKADEVKKLQNFDIKNVSKNAEGGRIGFSGGGIFRAIIAKAAAAKGLKPYEFIKVTSYKSLPREVKMFMSAEDFAQLKSGQKDMYSNYIDMAKTRKDFQQQVEAGKTTPARELFEGMEKSMDQQSYVPKTVTSDDIAQMELMVKNRFNKGRKDNALGGLQTMLGE